MRATETQASANPMLEEARRDAGEEKEIEDDGETDEALEQQELAPKTQAVTKEFGEIETGRGDIEGPTKQMKTTLAMAHLTSGQRSASWMS